MTQAPAPLFINPDVEKARVYTVNFTGGGAITATRGLLDAIFAAGKLTTGSCNAPTETVSVKSHTRTRVIGQPSTPVAGYNYSLKAYPTTPKLARSGGEEIKVRVNGEWWTARLSGSHQNFMNWLCANTSSLAVSELYWKSQHGTNYGPVGPGVTSLNP
jgi:hypothetical protein